jgi:hypothetical protein
MFLIDISSEQNPFQEYGHLFISVQFIIIFVPALNSSIYSISLEFWNEILYEILTSPGQMITNSSPLARTPLVISKEK